MAGGMIAPVSEGGKLFLWISPAGGKKRIGGKFRGNWEQLPQNHLTIKVVRT
jgi:hypothetical protein